MAAPVEVANVQRNVNLTCTIRLMRPGNMANLNPDILGVDINNFEADLAQSLANYITDDLNAQDNPAVVREELYIMRLHSNVVVNVNRAAPDGNVFNVNAAFTVKYNNEDFWDYDDRFMDRDLRLLHDTLIEDFSSLIQNVNNVGFFPQVENLVIDMDDEIPLVPIPVLPVAAPAQQVGIIPNAAAPPQQVGFIPDHLPEDGNENNNDGQPMMGGRRRRVTRRRRNTRRRSTRARRGRKN